MSMRRREGLFKLTANSLVTPENEQGRDLVAEDLPAGAGSMQVMVSVPVKARNIYLTSEYVTGWDIQSVKLTNYENYFLAALLLALAAVCLVYGTRYYRKEHRVILAFGMTGVLSCHTLSLELYAVLISRELAVWIFS